jgi:hypothetical protein
MDIAELMKNAREDPSLFSRINVKEILESLESVKNDFLENETFGTISENVFQSLTKLPITQKMIAEHCRKLVGYRYVDELHLLHKGKYVRWITHDDPNKIARGAVVVDIQFGDFGANVLCRLMTGQFLRYRFDKCNTYQKLTDEEQMILQLISFNT